MPSLTRSHSRTPALGGLAAHWKPEGADEGPWDPSETDHGPFVDYNTPVGPFTMDGRHIESAGTMRKRRGEVWRSALCCPFRGTGEDREHAFCIIPTFIRAIIPGRPHKRSGRSQGWATVPRTTLFARLPRPILVLLCSHTKYSHYGLDYRELRGDTSDWLPKGHLFIAPVHRSPESMSA